MRNLLAAALLLAASSTLAEVKLPQASPATTVSHEIGISKVTLGFHRPGVKWRKIWGGLVPLGQVWRLGANNATTVELSHAATINGQPVAAGKYALFAIPTEKEWTLILNSKHEQWGAYFHDPKLDVMRFSVTPEKAAFQEWFDIDLIPVSDRALRAAVTWETVRVPFTIAFDTPSLVWKSIDAALQPAAKPDWQAWHQAVRYSLETGARLDEASAWMDKAMATESFWNYELKARLLHRQGRTDDAYPLIAKAKELARGKAPQAYLDGLDTTVAEWKSGKTR